MPLFQPDLQSLILPLITLDSLATFKDVSLHESLIDILDSLYVTEETTETFLKNILLISGSIAAFIEHAETRISQKAIKSFASLV